MKRIIEALGAMAESRQILIDEPMSRHTTFRVGGPADFFVCPENARTLREVMLFLEKSGEPWQLIGRGSNLLVSDAGYRGVILALCDMKREPGTDAHLEADEDSRQDHADPADGEKNGAEPEEERSLLSLTVEGNRVRAGAGVSLGKTAGTAYRNGLGGMEFAAGIPGSVGGRFSEMSPVGLLPAAVCGIDIRAMLDGAAAMDARCKKEDVWKNPALLEAALQ